MSTAKSRERLVRSNSPTGCNHPVMTHLTADERKQLDRLATKDMRSLSATARMLIVQGLAAAEAE